MTTAVATRELVAGSTWWSIVGSSHPASSFNPNTAGDPSSDETGGRFHPFDSPPGVRVPTKYLGDHETGAFAETLMRDDTGESEVSLDTVRGHRLVLLGLRRTLLVADFVESTSGDALRSWLGQGRSAYPPLRTVAAELHASDVRLDGLLWEGRQLGRPGMNCVVLFGDRVDESADLDIVQELALDVGLGLSMLRAAARGRGVVLPESLVFDRV